MLSVLQWRGGWNLWPCRDDCTQSPGHVYQPPSPKLKYQPPPTNSVKAYKYNRRKKTWTATTSPLPGLHSIDVKQMRTNKHTNNNPLWLPINVTFKCVQNRKECRKADLGWQEHMWPVFSYKCVLSSWMGMHRVRYKLPGQLKSAFSPVTPPGSLRTDPDVRLTNEHLVPDFPPFIITWSLPVSEEIGGRKDLWK